jgi:UPF0271 protein
LNVNCDMGEAFGSWEMGNDAELMPLVDMANIACGFHASDPQIMERTVKLAVQSGTSIGAHPGYPDLQGFGRRDMAIPTADIRAMILYQVGALDAICRANNSRMDYVKPHGALYNRVFADRAVMAVVMQALHDYDDRLSLLVLASPDSDAIRRLADTHKIRVQFEAFSDRAYADDGTLLSRSIAGSVYKTAEQVRAQTEQIMTQGSVTSISGKVVRFQADTLCIHGDEPNAVQTAQVIREVIAGCSK